MQVRKQQLELYWFQIGKGVHQGCILSPCLFDLYAEYLMRNAGLEAQVGIKIARRNISYLRYADDTTLMAEYEEELKSLCFFFFFSFIFISWRLITLQYCSGFCHTLTWISHGFTCIPHTDPPSHLPLHPIPLGLPSAPAPSTCLMHPTWADDLFHPWQYTCFNAVLSKHPKEPLDESERGEWKSRLKAQHSEN